MTIAEQLIRKYNLEPHPEGGWYKQTYKSNEQIAAGALPERFGASRVFSTAIYFLLEKGNFSAFHRIKSDECWHFYGGDPLLIYVLDESGNVNIIALGNDFEYQSFQYVVPANCWFACMPAPQSEYCFAGCTVSPGFEFEDFELADANGLVKMYPQHERLIRMLSR
ncbi:MAG TPA: cupin domain-containing protein [Chitinophagaceae bacterium]